MVVRDAVWDDADSIATIYNEGIEDRIATFETEFRSAEDLRSWFESGLPFLVVDGPEGICAFVVGVPYSDRCAYSGIIDFSVYVRRSDRGKGYGRTIMEQFLQVARERRYHKVIGKLLALNDASLGMLQSVGFSEVGLHKRHGQIDGEWHDVRLVELLL